MNDKKNGAWNLNACFNTFQTRLYNVHITHIRALLVFWLILESSKHLYIQASMDVMVNAKKQKSHLLAYGQNKFDQLWAVRLFLEVNTSSDFMKMTKTKKKSTNKWTQTKYQLIMKLSIVRLIRLVLFTTGAILKYVRMGYTVYLYGIRSNVRASVWAYTHVDCATESAFIYSPMFDDIERIWNLNTSANRQHICTLNT